MIRYRVGFRQYVLNTETDKERDVLEDASDKEQQAIYDREVKQKREYALKLIKERLGERENDEYTPEEIKNYVKQYYGAKEITVEEFIKYGATGGKTFSATLEYMSPENTTLYMLPLKEPSGILTGGDKVMLALEEKDGKMHSFWLGYNDYGYEELRATMHNFIKRTCHD